MPLSRAATVPVVLLGVLALFTGIVAADSSVEAEPLVGTPSDTVWEATVDALGPKSDEATGVAVDAVGNQYVTGWTDGALPDADPATRRAMLIRKYDVTGAVEWTRTYQPASGIRVMKAADVAAFGDHVYVVGEVGGPFADTEPMSQFDAFVLQLDSDGELGWIDRIDGGSPTAVATHTTGVYVSALDSVGLFGTGGWVRRYELDGTLSWERVMDCLQSCRIRPFPEDVAVGDDAVYAVGTTNGRMSPGEPMDSNAQDVVVRAWDHDGAEQWTTRIGELDVTETLGGVAAAGDGPFIAYDTHGIHAAPVDEQTMFVRHLAVDGTVRWEWRSDDTHPDLGGLLGPIPMDVAADDDGAYVAGFRSAVDHGSLHREPSIHHVDSTGELVWVRTFGTPPRNGPQPLEQVNGIAVRDGMLGVAGLTEGEIAGHDAFVGHKAVTLNRAGGREDVIVGRYTTAGNQVWTAQAGSTDPHSSSEQVDRVATAGDTAYLGGVTSGVLEGQEATGGQDAFIRRVDETGDTIWTRQWGAEPIYEGATYLRGLAADATGVYAAARRAEWPLAPAGLLDEAVVRKYGPDGTLVWEQAVPGLTAGEDFHDLADIGIHPDGIVATGRRSAGAYLRLRGSSDGTVSWTRTITGLDDGARVPLDVDVGKRIVTGGFAGTSGDHRGFVSVFDLDGNPLWLQRIGDPTEMGRTQVHGVADGGNRIYAWGQTDRAVFGEPSTEEFLHPFLVAYSPDGTRLWSYQFPGRTFRSDLSRIFRTDRSLSIDADHTGAYLTMPQREDLEILGVEIPAVPGSDHGSFLDPPEVLLLKIDLVGNLDWYEQTYAQNTIFAADITVDAHGVIVGGRYRHAVDSGGLSVLAEEDGFALRFTPQRSEP